MCTCGELSLRSIHTPPAMSASSTTIASTIHSQRHVCGGGGALRSMRNSFSSSWARSMRGWSLSQSGLRSIAGATDAM
jgi:hypothetical protein